MRPQLLLGEHRDFVKAKFEEDVAEGLMEKMTLGEFKVRGEPGYRVPGGYRRGRGEGQEEDNS